MPETASNEKKTARIRNVIIRSVLLVGFAVIALSVLLNLVSPAIANKQIAVEYGTRILSDVGLSFVVSEESEISVIPLGVRALQSLRHEYGESAVNVTLSGVVLSGEQLSSTEERICLTTLWIAEPLPVSEEPSVLGEYAASLADTLNQIPIERTLSYEFDDFCAERGTAQMRSSGDEDVLIGVLPFSQGLSPYYYPFDTRTLGWEVWVDAEIENQDGTSETITIAPNMRSQYNLPEWQLTLFAEQETPENRTHPVASQHLTMQRPFASRLLTTTLLASLFVIILLLGFTRQMDAFVQASVAVLLTLLGIQDLLVPTAISEATIVDQTILAFYVLFALAILGRLTIKPLWDLTPVGKSDEPDDGAGA
ncbi:MAG: hypothetical protein ACK2U2_08425 [Anaerolineae bacterium]|jgi:hypothetical protein